MRTILAIATTLFSVFNYASAVQVEYDFSGFFIGDTEITGTYDFENRIPPPTNSGNIRIITDNVTGEHTAVAGRYSYTVFGDVESLADGSAAGSNLMAELQFESIPDQVFVVDGVSIFLSANAKSVRDAPSTDPTEYIVFYGVQTIFHSGVGYTLFEPDRFNSLGITEEQSIYLTDLINLPSAPQPFAGHNDTGDNYAPGFGPLTTTDGRFTIASFSSSYEGDTDFLAARFAASAVPVPPSLLLLMAGTLLMARRK